MKAAKRIPWWCALTSVLVAVMTGGVMVRSTGPAQVAYVTLAGEGRIAVYDVDGQTGAWSLKQTLEVGPGVGPIAVSPDRRRLYVAVRGEGAAATLAAGDDGKLTLLGKADIAGSSPYLATDHGGQWLLAAYYADGKATVHRIDEQGLVTPGPWQEVKTDENAHSIFTDASNRFAFVPHTGPSAIYQFRFDGETGRLEPNQPPVVIAPNGAGPRHFRFHPTLDVAYFINELDSTVTAYHFDREKGTLMEFQNLPTLPEDFEERNTCADLHLTPDGRFLYGSNRGHDSLAAYAVDPETGRLTPIGWFETERTPRSFALDTTGRFLYAAGQTSDKVAAYRIDRQTGRLTRFATYEPGRTPTWIEVLALQ